MGGGQASIPVRPNAPSRDFHQRVYTPAVAAERRAEPVPPDQRQRRPVLGAARLHRRLCSPYRLCRLARRPTGRPFTYIPTLPPCMELYAETGRAGAHTYRAAAPTIHSSDKGAARPERPESA